MALSFTTGIHNGIPYGIANDSGPLGRPTIFVFGNDINTTFTDPDLRRPAEEAVSRGWIAVTLDIWDHGARQVGTGGLPGWADTIRNGGTLEGASSGGFLADCSSMMDWFVSGGLTDANQFAACGTSRGAYAALRLAQVDSRIRGVMGLNPLLYLSYLSEFQDFATEPEALSPAALASTLIWLNTGMVDQRVGTWPCFDFASQLRVAQGTAANTKVVTSNTTNHTSDPLAPAMGMDWLISRL